MIHRVYFQVKCYISIFSWLTHVGVLLFHLYHSPVDTLYYVLDDNHSNHKPSIIGGGTMIASEVNVI